MLFQKILPESAHDLGIARHDRRGDGPHHVAARPGAGTLVGSAYGFFAVQKANVETLGARAIQLDIALAQYGEETRPLRDGLKGAIAAAHEAIWGSDNGVDGQGDGRRELLVGHRRC